jgi:redox-sensitive bicupin YhaK (pirin superfamily)
VITIRKGEERGHRNRGWLDAHFSFSFADYYDAEHTNFRSLRVLNDDFIAPGKGFGPHAHRDMEIVTYVLEGGLLHRDSMGQEHILRPNEVQTMSAGNGIVHSEFNASETERVHSIQIWIEPSAEDFVPSYQQISFAPAEKQGRFRLLAGPEPNPSEPSTVIHQDVKVFVAELGANVRLNQSIRAGRYAWIQILRGSVSLNGHTLKEGDGASSASSASSKDELELSFTGADGGCELLLFDLA